MDWRPPHAETPDGALVTEWMTGNNLAGSELYRRYGDEVFRFACQHIGGDREAAADICQETFQRFIRYVKENHFEAENGGVRKFLYTVAHHAIQDIARKKHLSFRRRTQGGLTDDRSNTRRTPSEDAIHREDGERLMAAISTLSDYQRRILMEYYYNGRTLKAIGSSLGKSEVAIHRLLKDTEERLRRMMYKGESRDEMDAA
jgi:RNA polymerase sigma factor (sigma-70 family)